jgi:MoxR-like ATPase
MNVDLLFRKRTPLSEWGLPWLRGGETHPWIARRNPTREAVASAILVRSLLSALEGSILSADLLSDGVEAAVNSHSRAGVTTFCWWEFGHLVGTSPRLGIPHGEPDKVTYHLGVLAIVDALVEPEKAGDFWQAYASLVAAFKAHGKAEAIKEPLCRSADELYYWTRYRDGDPDPADCRLLHLEIGPNDSTRREASERLRAIDLAPLYDPSALHTNCQPGETPSPVEPATSSGFVGWQVQALVQALRNGENVLLAGPTGTGKTYAAQQVVEQLGASLVIVEGKESLIDLDFLGAILPKEDGGRAWVDGPLLRALRQAWLEPVVLFLDEINRIPRQQVNLLLGLMNPKSQAACQMQGLDLPGAGPFYVIEVPMTSDVVACPVAHLHIVAAGNFGRVYQVYDLDPAVRRRFDTIIEFDYLPYQQELSLLRRESGLEGRLAEALVRVAHETRRLLENGELPGCVDTASLLNWGRKVRRAGAATVQSVMAQAHLTWADLVCGREHTGRLNPGNFQAIQDYLTSLGLLPEGVPDPILTEAPHG